MMVHNNKWDPNIAKTIGLTPEAVENLGSLLDSLHESIDGSFNHINQKKHSYLYLTGLLSDIPRKNIESIALEFGDVKTVRTLQHFFQKGKWDENYMHQVYLREVSPYIADCNGMLMVDGCGFTKKGTESVGVARQYNGSEGKVSNCQVGVFLGYSSNKGYALLDTQLYMPEKWFDTEYDEQREKCEVPDDLEFLTKPQIAINLLENINQSDLFPAKWAGFDAEFGGNHDFLDSLPDNQYYFADQKSNILVWLEWPEVSIPPYKGRGPYPTKPKAEEAPVSLKDIAKDPSLPWEKRVLGDGAKGPIIGELAVIRVITRRDELPYREEWLIIRRLENDTLKFAFSDAPIDTPKEEFYAASLMRWPIEQTFHFGKSHIGMDEYELRSWLGWHRHMLYVFLAMLILIVAQWLFENDEKPALTLPQVKRLIIASFSKKVERIVKTIDRVLYTMKRNYAAYKSHRKNKLRKLAGQHL